MELGQKYDLDPIFLKTVLENIHLESIRFQMKQEQKINNASNQTHFFI